jgi:hypothetical protein
MRQGDLSELTTVSIVDPLAPGRPAFPGNIIPTNRISQQALKILQYMPQANGTGVLNNFNANVPNNNDTINTPSASTSRLESRTGFSSAIPIATRHC